ncbi:hypothetical protein PPL_01489 [Heterostelium album PN500]|uniref:F-box domain-containing protein n=1 Tax=Heterostelium pallidum (strain ATCC 26659 / Pp 5 / PN500) TaxID=670386 RepID=D3AZE8_HETP5|nr:hypothetical protein PPL_01489 [Heterostelium album PN500]EFA85531.1 hypothetical protein PPL_01489 [Heterostelium album PN500]|eukprot:XP_020437639.1 hypothetical protein PPL_01489 [Heterostelium album PN500]
MNTNNNNDNNNFVNIPHIILRYIINYLDNIDRLCFSLTCKRWFHERNRYFIFNPDDLVHQSLEYTYPSFKLNSYRDIIHRSLELKTICRLNIRAYLTPIGYSNFDYVIHKDSLVDYKIPLSCRSLTLPDDLEESDLEHLRKTLVDSSITEIENYQVSKRGPLSSKITSICYKGTKMLPSNVLHGLTRLELVYFNRPLEPGTLPSTLQYLKFKSFNQPLSPGCLPEGLIDITFGHAFQHPIESGVLPNSLKSLTGSRTYSEQVIQKGALPPNLETLKFARLEPISNLEIPASLVTLEGIPIAWLPLIKDLKNLRNLSIAGFDGDRLKPGDIPEGVVNLKLSRAKVMANENMPNIIPYSVKYLHLDDCDYAFPVDLAYDFEEVKISGSTTINHQLSYVKINKLDLQDSKLVFNQQNIPERTNSIVFSSNVTDNFRYSNPANELMIKEIDKGYFCIFGKTRSNLVSGFFHESQSRYLFESVDTNFYKS